MRVIAGRWKGRRLKSPNVEGIRPTTDRVKEALFNILSAEVHGCLFLDLCCGAGGLGIEALSRGAARVIFVDRSSRALALVGDNLAVCGAAKDTTELVCADALDWLAGWRPPVNTGGWVLVADPPYRSGVAGAIMKDMERLAVDPGFKLGFVEHGIRTPDLPDGARGPLKLDTRRYGESCLAVIRSSGTDCLDEREGP